MGNCISKKYFFKCTKYVDQIQIQIFDFICDRIHTNAKNCIFKYKYVFDPALTVTFISHQMFKQYIYWSLTF